MEFLIKSINKNLLTNNNSNISLCRQQVKLENKNKVYKIPNKSSESFQLNTHRLYSRIRVGQHPICIREQMDLAESYPVILGRLVVLIKLILMQVLATAIFRIIILIRIMLKTPLTSKILTSQSFILLSSQMNTNRFLIKTLYKRDSSLIQHKPQQPFKQHGVIQRTSLNRFYPRKSNSNTFCNMEQVLRSITRSNLDRFTRVKLINAL